MKKFLEHIEEEETDEVVHLFYDLIEKQLIKKGIQLDDDNYSGVQFAGMNREDKYEVRYDISPYWTGYFPEVRKTLDIFDSVLKPLNSYPDMIIMNWHLWENTVEITIIWKNFIKTDLYKSLKTTGKYNL